MESFDSEVLDINSLGVMLRERRGALSLRQAAKEAGVSFSTFTRVENGSQPDLASLAKLCAWLGVSTQRFLGEVAEKQPNAIESAIAHIKASPELTPDNANAIAAMMRQMYATLAQPLPAPSVVSCHLRAARLLRPGVPARIGSLLQDISTELNRLEASGKL